MTPDMREPLSQPRRVFVGRECELALLHASLAAALAGHGCLVLLSGEPGIGKTRLAEELAQYAGAEGATVRWGRCWEGSGAPPFWPWIQILRAEIKEADPEELRAQLGSGAEEIVRLVPDLQERLPGLAAAPLPDDAGARFRLFDSVAGFLKASAAHQPLVLILEDLHWAQPDVLELLRFLADGLQEARLLVVATYRDITVSEEHPLTEVLGALPYRPLVERIKLAGLSEQEIGALIEALGHKRSAALAARVHEDSGGNPFFATELLRSTDTKGIPGGVRDAIGHRLRRLSEGCRRLLGIASVIGPDFELATLERVVDDAGRPTGSIAGLADPRTPRLPVMPAEAGIHAQRDARGGFWLPAFAGMTFPAGPSGTEAQGQIEERTPSTRTESEKITAGTPILRLLSEAKDAHIVVQAEQATGRYRFTHALIRGVLYAGLPLDDRLGLHWQVAAALEALAGPSRDRGASALAHHFSEAIAGCAEGAGRQGCVDKALVYATRAAEQATAMCAYEEAATHYGRAVRMLEDWAAHDKRRLCELLLAMGKAQTRAHEKYAMRSKTFHRAAALARDLDEPELLVRAALDLSLQASLQEMANRAHIDLLREALDTVGPEDSGVRAQLLAFLSMSLHDPDPRVYSVALSEEAVAVARRVADPRALWPALLGKYQVMVEPEQTEERMRVATEILRLGVELGDSEVLLYGQLYRLRSALVLGQIATLDRELAAFERLANELGQPFFRWRAVSTRAGLALLGGRFPEADRLVVKARQLMGHSDNPYVFSTWSRQTYLSYWEQGRLGEIEPLVTGGGDAPDERVQRAHFYAETGRMSEAHGEIDVLADEEFRGLPREWRGGLMAMVTYASAILGDVKYAPKLYALLLPYQPHLIVDIYTPLCLGSVSLYLGLLAGLMRRWDDALHHLDEALAAHTRINSPPWIANSNYASAEVLLARNGPGDRERASALLADVLKTTERLGMRRLQRKALALQDCHFKFPSPLAGEGKDGGFQIFSPPPESSPIEGEKTSQAQERPAPAIQATFRKEADYWVIGYKTPPFRLKDRIGLRYLEMLLRNPDKEFLAIDLVAAVQGRPDRPPPSGPTLPRGDYEGGLSSRRDKNGASPLLGSPEPYFDEEARRAYTQRLRDLRAALEEAEAFNDRERASRVQGEMDSVTDELRRGIGLSGRIRPSGSPVELARVSVTRAIKAALLAIAKNDAELGRYLAATIRTGTFCSYSAEPRVTVTWHL